MIPHKNNNGKRFGLGDRLQACIERVGGKRAMCNATLISEAQLFRYINGDTDVPSERIVMIAKAAGVDPGWLLTGEGSTEKANTELRPSFRSELMVQLVQIFEELLVEFDKPFNPRQRARALTFLYNALRHEEVKRGTQYQPSKFDILRSLNYISELRTEEELQLLIDAMNLLEYSPDIHELSDAQRELIRMWNNLVVRGTKAYYSSYAGQVYYERTTGGHLNPSTVLELQNLVTLACQSVGKTELDWLDLGCGSGRHLLHLANHFSNIRLKGLEISQLGYNICKDLMDSEKLPKETVVMADVRHIPFASQSFDVIYANLSLYCLPYVPDTNLGMEEAFQEISRLLRSKGLAKLVFPEGDWRDYSMSYQYMNEKMIRSIAAKFGLIVKDIMIEEDSPTVVAANTNPMKLNHQRFIHVTLSK